MNVTLRDAERYVGTPYLAGAFDCADLCQKVQWELFGRLIALPGQRQRPGGIRGQARLIATLRDDVADRIDGPVTGAAVLFWETRAAVCTVGDGRMWHVGTVFMRASEVWVLHNSEKLGGAVLQKLQDLQRYGLHLEGYYEWRVAS